METIWYGEFRSIQDISNAFKARIPVDVEILYAFYTYEDYSGEAVVIFRIDGKLYENDGLHCSCYGLEGLWEPTEVSLPYLRHVFENGTKYPHMRDKLGILLTELESDPTCTSPDTARPVPAPATIEAFYERVMKTFQW